MDTKLIGLVAVLIIIIGAIVYQSNSDNTSLPPQTNQENITIDSENSAPAETTDGTIQQKGGETQMKFNEAPKMEIDVAKKYTAVVKTNKGDMTIELYTKEAPKTVNNFVFLAKKSFYDGVIFHRVIKDFMIQGGDPTGTGMGGPGYQFEDEMNDFVFDTGGILAMANSGPNTNGSQFFITHAATPWLTGKHTIFGKVTKGMDVLNTIATTAVGAQDKPVDKISIQTIEIIEK